MLKESTFKKFTDFFYDKAGIRLTAEKKYLIINRLDKIIGADKSFKTYDDYYKSLSEDFNGDLTKDFINRLTTNYSFFFREEAHFDFLEYFLLNRISDRKYLRIWSAACSTGEEPYAIALLAKRCLINIDELDFRILATDISTKVLEKAKEGTYELVKVNNRNKLDRYLSYFSKDKEGHITVKDEIKKLITFKQLNLLSTYPFKKKFDIVFLRNVLIYFENNEKEIILNKIYDVIKPDGYLIMGLSESLIGVKTDFKNIKYSIYKK